jgi:hypothetical protein
LARSIAVATLAGSVWIDDAWQGLGTIAAEAGTVASLAGAIAATDAGSRRLGQVSAIATETWAIASVDAGQGRGTVSTDSRTITTTDSRSVAATDSR